MKFSLNNTPELTMVDITKRLFNINFLSDIQFNIGGKVIYAHSLELMKRSLVFQQQLESTLGDKKLIPIANYGYDSFYQLIRFIYTDECEMKEEYGIELLKLAINYKIVRLENKVIEFLIACDAQILLALYEFSIANSYALAYNRVKGEIAWYLNFCLDSEKFLYLPQNVIEEILQMDYVYKDIKEETIFKGLLRWINHFCAENGIEAENRRTQFDSLIRLVRFPTMKFEEFRDCAAQNRDLFTDGDYTTIFKQIAFGPDKGEENPRWLSTPRLEYKLPVEYRGFLPGQRFETKFTVSMEIILCGLRYGNELSKPNHYIFITAKNRDTNVNDVLKFMCEPQTTVFEHNIISLGESIRLQTNFVYTIGFKFLVKTRGTDVLCRGIGQDMLVSDPLGAVNILEPGANMIEIIFKAPVDNSPVLNHQIADGTMIDCPVAVIPVENHPVGEPPVTDPPVNDPPVADLLGMDP